MVSETEANSKRDSAKVKNNQQTTKTTNGKQYMGKGYFRKKNQTDIESGQIKDNLINIASDVNEPDYVIRELAVESADVNSNVISTADQNFENENEAKIKRESISVAEMHIQKMPVVEDNGISMAVWTDIKEIIFPSCSDPRCDIVLNVIKEILDYPNTEAHASPCTPKQQMAFLRNFRIVPCGTLLVNTRKIQEKIQLLKTTVRTRHITSEETFSKECYYAKEHTSHDHLLSPDRHVSTEFQKMKSAANNHFCWCVLPESQVTNSFVNEAEFDPIIYNGRYLIPAMKLGTRPYVPMILVHPYFRQFYSFLFDLSRDHLVGTGSDMTRCLSLLESNCISSYIARQQGWGARWRHITSRDLMIDWQKLCKHIKNPPPVLAAENLDLSNNVAMVTPLQMLYDTESDQSSNTLPCDTYSRNHQTWMKQSAPKTFNRNSQQLISIVKPKDKDIQHFPVYKKVILMPKSKADEQQTAGLSQFKAESFAPHFATSSVPKQGTALIGQPMLDFNHGHQKLHITPEIKTSNTKNGHLVEDIPLESRDKQIKTQQFPGQLENPCVDRKSESYIGTDGVTQKTYIFNRCSTVPNNSGSYTEQDVLTPQQQPKKENIHGTIIGHTGNGQKIILITKNVKDKTSQQDIKTDDGRLIYLTTIQKNVEGQVNNKIMPIDPRNINVQNPKDVERTACMTEKEKVIIMGQKQNVLPVAMQNKGYTPNCEVIEESADTTKSSLVIGSNQHISDNTEEAVHAINNKDGITGKKQSDIVLQESLNTKNGRNGIGSQQQSNRNSIDKSQPSNKEFKRIMEHLSNAVENCNSDTSQQPVTLDMEPSDCQQTQILEEQPKSGQHSRGRRTKKKKKPGKHALSKKTQTPDYLDENHQESFSTSKQQIKHKHEVKVGNPQQIAKTGEHTVKFQDSFHKLQTVEDKNLESERHQSLTLKHGIGSQITEALKIDKPSKTENHSKDCKNDAGNHNLKYLTAKPNYQNNQKHVRPKSEQVPLTGKLTENQLKNATKRAVVLPVGKIGSGKSKVTESSRLKISSRIYPTKVVDVVGSIIEDSLSSQKRLEQQAESMASVKNCDLHISKEAPYREILFENDDMGNRSKDRLMTLASASPFAPDSLKTWRLLNEYDHKLISQKQNQKPNSFTKYSSENGKATNKGTVELEKVKLPLISKSCDLFPSLPHKKDGQDKAKKSISTPVLASEKAKYKVKSDDLKLTFYRIQEQNKKKGVKGSKSSTIGDSRNVIKGSNLQKETQKMKLIQGKELAAKENYIKPKTRINSEIENVATKPREKQLQRSNTKRPSHHRILMKTSNNNHPSNKVVADTESGQEQRVSKTKKTKQKKKKSSHIGQHDSDVDWIVDDGEPDRCKGVRGCKSKQTDVHIDSIEEQDLQEIIDYDWGLQGSVFVPYEDKEQGNRCLRRSLRSVLTSKTYKEVETYNENDESDSDQSKEQSPEKERQRKSSKKESSKKMDEFDDNQCKLKSVEKMKKRKTKKIEILNDLNESKSIKKGKKKKSRKSVKPILRIDDIVISDESSGESLYDPQLDTNFSQDQTFQRNGESVIIVNPIDQNLTKIESLDDLPDPKLYGNQQNYHGHECLIIKPGLMSLIKTNKNQGNVEDKLELPHGKIKNNVGKSSMFAEQATQMRPYTTSTSAQIIDGQLEQENSCLQSATKTKKKKGRKSKSKGKKKDTELIVEEEELKLSSGGRNRDILNSTYMDKVVQEQQRILEIIKQKVASCQNSAPRDEGASICRMHIIDENNNLETENRRSDTHFHGFSTELKGNNLVNNREVNGEDNEVTEYGGHNFDTKDINLSSSDTSHVMSGCESNTHLYECESTDTVSENYQMPRLNQTNPKDYQKSTEYQNEPEKNCVVNDDSNTEYQILVLGDDKNGCGNLISIDRNIFEWAEKELLGREKAESENFEISSDGSREKNAIESDSFYIVMDNLPLANEDNTMYYINQFGGDEVVTTPTLHQEVVESFPNKEESGEVATSVSEVTSIDSENPFLERYENLSEENLTLTSDRYENFSQENVTLTSDNCENLHDNNVTSTSDKYDNIFPSLEADCFGTLTLNNNYKQNVTSEVTHKHGLSFKQEKCKAYEGDLKSMSAVTIPAIGADSFISDSTLHGGQSHTSVETVSAIGEESHTNVTTSVIGQDSNTSNEIESCIFRSSLSDITVSTIGGNETVPMCYKEMSESGSDFTLSSTCSSERMNDLNGYCQIPIHVKTEENQKIETDSFGIRHVPQYDESGVSNSGIIFHEMLMVPYVAVNGYKYVVLRDIVHLFTNGCQPKCQISKNVLKRIPGLPRTFCSWEQVYLLDQLSDCPQRRTIQTGEMLLRFDTVLFKMANIRKVIQDKHKNTRLKNSQNCQYSLLDSY